MKLFAVIGLTLFVTGCGLAPQTVSNPQPARFCSYLESNCENFDPNPQLNPLDHHDRHTNLKFFDSGGLLVRDIKGKKILEAKINDFAKRNDLIIVEMQPEITLGVLDDDRVEGYWVTFKKKPD